MALDLVINIQSNQHQSKCNGKYTHKQFHKSNNSQSSTLLCIIRVMLHYIIVTLH